MAEIEIDIAIYDTKNWRRNVNINIPKAMNTRNTYFPPRDTASPHYTTVDTDIAYCIRHVTNMPDSILTGYVNAHSILWYTHTDDHRGPLISDTISNSELSILNTDTPHQTTISTTLYNRTTWHTIHALNLDHLSIITRINTNTNYNKTNTYSRTIGQQTDTIHYRYGGCFL